MQAPAHAQQQPEEALLRLQYAMALLRLVNGISDPGQKGRLALSVAQLANDAGVAGLLVTCTLLSCLAPLFPHAKLHPIDAPFQRCPLAREPAHKGAC